MSRPNVTDTIVEGLLFARACVIDQRAASHARKDHSWDQHYAKALDAIYFLARTHEIAAKKTAKKGTTP